MRAHPQLYYEQVTQRLPPISEGHQLPPTPAPTTLYADPIPPIQNLRVAHPNAIRPLPGPQTYTAPSQLAVATQGKAAATCSHPVIMAVTLFLVVAVIGAVVVVVVVVAGDDSGNCDGFYCSSGGRVGSNCLLSTEQCDGFVDCNDGEDEDGCSTSTTCDGYSCSTSSYCISNSRVCDGIADCQDGDDESGCDSATCNGYFCSDSNDCISSSLRCDGNSDCSSGEDESSCGTTTCNGFYCSDSARCISSSKRCDGISDCTGGQDEVNCASICSTQYCTLSWSSHAATLCLPSHWICDGITDCSGGTDETNCQSSCTSQETYCDGGCKNTCDRVNDCSDLSDEISCSAYCVGSFDCRTGNRFGTYCISNGRVCDGTNDCNDNSDEENCDTSCPSGYFTCGNDCIRSEYVCDGHAHCADGSDEAGCTSYCDGYFYCAGGYYSYSGTNCIPSTFQCDGYNDCNDGEDEQDCADVACPDSQFKCTEGSVYGLCIPGSWQCDGINDCNGEVDEEGCSTEPPLAVTEYYCRHDTSKTKILKTQVCDGAEDCPGGTDEDQCVVLTSLSSGKVQIYSVETLTHHEICADDWTAEKSNAVCVALGFKSSTSFTTDMTTDDQGIISTGDFDINALVQLAPTTCTGNHVVHVTCSTDDWTCGDASTRSGSETRIVGGEDVTVENYPWQVSLQISIGGGWGHFCGGTIINEHWVVTATHCFPSLTSSEYSKYRVVAGVTRLSDSNSEGSIYTLANVHLHPLYSTTTFFADVALIQVLEKFNYSSAIQPACLPASGEMFPDGVDSLVSGWGALSEGGSSPNTLQAVTLPLANTEACRSDFTEIANHVLDGMICAGLVEGGKDSCQGDSGGPLVAISNGRAYLAGVTSWGIGCARPNHPGVYAETSFFVDWIKREMVKG